MVNFQITHTDFISIHAVLCCNVFDMQTLAIYENIIILLKMRALLVDPLHGEFREHWSLSQSGDTKTCETTSGINLDIVFY